ITGKKRLLSWKNKPDEIQLRVIPNPATQSFTVLSSKNTVVKGKIHIINSMGEVVKITTITEEGGGIIHTESLLPGFYAIEVYTGTEVLHSTVIIHK
ncbi:MAG TPA: T9SS type A sorting domain-containing protein, partial [Candidatus Kapabacteria bacterium]|nr:T9SS type A sorting domain-containing protein [Candidatus Kapabacteria bacterium]